MAVSQTYSQVGNDAQVYELVEKSHKTRQGEKSVAYYYAKFSAVWQETDYYKISKLIVLLMLENTS